MIVFLDLEDLKQIQAEQIGGAHGDDVCGGDAGCEHDARNESLLPRSLTE
jgi:hypothetical protein